jgi:hypothetical protein
LEELAPGLVAGEGEGGPEEGVGSAVHVFPAVLDDGQLRLP